MRQQDVTPVAVTFGRRLRAWRRRKNYSILAVAEDLSVSKQIVSEWERGIRFPSQNHLMAITRYTEMPLCIFFREGPCRCNPDAPCGAAPSA